MSKTSNQKLKIVYLMKIMMEKTDETHSITMSEIIEELKKYGINAERKSIYNDIECLRQYGMDLIGTQEKGTYCYHVGNRQFELAELKLLVDSVQSARFITVKKSNELIKKIEGFASEYEARQLHRQVYVAERIKTVNENIYYNVDMIHSAIAENSQIIFHYFQWNVDKEMELRRKGAYYTVSPWALSWTDEYYYMIAYDSEDNKIKHFRVDKMLHIEMTKRRREGHSMFRQFDMAVYVRKLFGMYDGEEQIVKIQCRNHLAGVIIDRFGKNVSLIKTDAEHFVANVKAAVSRPFLFWVMALGEDARIVGPEAVVKQVETEIERLAGQYGK